jgi:hypothetical protein
MRPLRTRHRGTHDTAGDSSFYRADSSHLIEQATERIQALTATHKATVPNEAVTARMAPFAECGYVFTGSGAVVFKTKVGQH